MDKYTYEDHPIDWLPCKHCAYKDTDVEDGPCNNCHYTDGKRTKTTHFKFDLNKLYG